MFIFLPWVYFGLVMPPKNVFSSLKLVLCLSVANLLSPFIGLVLTYILGLGLLSLGGAHGSIKSKSIS